MLGIPCSDPDEKLEAAGTRAVAVEVDRESGQTLDAFWRQNQHGFLGRNIGRQRKQLCLKDRNKPPKTKLQISPKYLPVEPPLLDKCEIASLLKDLGLLRNAKVQVN